MACCEQRMMPRRTRFFLTGIHGHLDAVGQQLDTLSLELFEGQSDCHLL
jgi:hypothetical protein